MRSSDNAPVGTTSSLSRDKGVPICMGKAKSRAPAAVPGVGVAPCEAAPNHLARLLVFECGSENSRNQNDRVAGRAVILRAAIIDLAQDCFARIGTAQQEREQKQWTDQSSTKYSRDQSGPPQS